MMAPSRPERAFFGRRKGHKLRPRQAALLETLLPTLAIDTGRAPPASLRALFRKRVDSIEVDAIHLEIGFGGGENLVARATANPATGFIGIEPFVNGMAKALAAIDGAKLDNVRLYSDDATGLLEWLPDASIERIDLIHPDPWPKRRHWKRRFVQDASVAQLARILRPGGELRFVTDIADYAAWTLACVARSKDLLWIAECADDWRRPWDDFAGTRYHAKAASAARRSCFLIFRRRQRHRNCCGG